MQHLNYYLVVCAVTASVCVIPASHAQDTEDQAKARQALRETITQLDGSAPAPQDTEAQAKAREEVRKSTYHVQPTTTEPVIVQPPAASPPAASSTVTITMDPASVPADDQAIERARQAVRQQLGEPYSVPTDSPEAARAREATRQELARTSQPVPTEAQVAQPVAEVVAVQSTPNAAKDEQAQAEAQRKAEKAAKDEAEKSEAAAQAERRAKHNANVAPAAYQPIESPALPISSDKQQRLAELLQKYRSDQITPEQYHEERAKILGAP